MLACALLVVIPSQAHAQSDEAQAKANRLKDKCAEFYRSGKYDEAIEHCQRALMINETALGSEHPGVADLLNNLAVLHKTKSEYAKAETLYLRSLAIREKVFGSDHPAVANSLSNLAELYRAKGEYAKAEPLYQRSLLINEKMLGPEHPSVGTIMNNLALLYNAKGDYAKAEPLYLRALAIHEKALGSDHPDLAIALHNLAELYHLTGDYAKAEPLYQRALAMREKALGGEHPDVATSLNNLALLHNMKSDYAKAEPLFLRALAIREKAFGPEHPDVAQGLNNLALLHHMKGEYAKAESLFLRALAIYEKALGSEHPKIANSLNNLALLYEAKGDYPRAIEFLTRAEQVRESNINAILATGSENQKQLYLNTLTGETYSTVSLHAHSAPENVQAARLALTTILRRKGRALDAMTDQIAALRRRAAPDDLKLLDALAGAQSELASLQLSGDARLPPAERRARVAALETEIEKLQGDIGRRNVEFRARTAAVTLDAVRTAIPTDAALVEIFAYQPFNVKAKSVVEIYGATRYVAYVLKPHGDTPQFVDLGDAAEIDSELKPWREALLDPEREDVRALGRRVDERVMRPIRKLLGPTRRLFISPDGALNLIPFAALVDENNKYLMETYALNYLTSGRDLLRLKVSSETRPGAVIFANPTYNLTGQVVAACQRPKRKRGLLLNSEDADSANEKNATVKRDVAYRGIDFTKACYPPLKGTAEEAQKINGLLPSARVLTDRHATEAALKGLNSPPVLHVATHGFFLPDQPQSLNKDGAQGAGASSTENPLLRSGLIMAGANQKSSGAGEDGVLTAAEAAGLNLWGTKLVVLSACETGLGDVVNGAGVYGLRRALVLAGSETQVMSLWQVDDAATRDLMSDYYTRLKRGEGRNEAMRRAQLGMLRGETQNRAKTARTRLPSATIGDRHAHPYYWAAFISSGDWRSMNGKVQ
jgi:CHAT domain-containing protein/Tfp pilus assembly protein PilF